MGRYQIRSNIRINISAILKWIFIDFRQKARPDRIRKIRNKIRRAGSSEPAFIHGNTSFAGRAFYCL